MHVDLTEMSDAELKEWRKQADDRHPAPEDRDEVVPRCRAGVSAPSSSSTPSRYLGPGGMPMNRAQRRQADKGSPARKKRRSAKKAPSARPRRPRFRVRARTELSRRSIWYGDTNSTPSPTQTFGILMS